MTNREFLKLLVCPASRRPLREATAAELAAVNAAVAAGGLLNRGGQPVAAALVGGLVPEGGDVIYPVVDGIPILLSAEAIPLAPGKGTPAKG